MNKKLLISCPGMLSACLDGLGNELWWSDEAWLLGCLGQGGSLLTQAWWPTGCWAPELFWTSELLPTGKAGGQEKEQEDRTLHLWFEICCTRGCICLCVVLPV